MKALLVYESMFGNTEKIARAVGDGLSQEMQVELFEVRDAPPVITDLVDLVIVGGPTHAFSLSRSKHPRRRGPAGRSRRARRHRPA